MSIRVGLWLGSANRITRLRWTKTYGWIATDSTGARYSQRRSRQLAVRHQPGGLPCSEHPAPTHARTLHRWPETPEP